MRKFNSVVFVLTALFSHVAFADTWIDPNTGITWTYTVNDGEASVGSGYSSPAVLRSTTGAITIPSTIDEHQVTRIGEWAFNNCSGLTSVTIPEGVTSIGQCAFEGCSGVTSVEIPSSVTSIGGSAFNYCTGLRRVRLPNSMTDVQNYTFYMCKCLESVELPLGLKSIGYATFLGCTNLSTITIPTSVSKIGNYAFQSCSKLSSVELPFGLQSVECGTFSGCTGLTNAVIPVSVTSIGDYAFTGCRELANLTIPSAVTNVGDCAFSGCLGLGEGLVVVDGWLITCNGGTEEDLVVDNQVINIAGGAFRNSEFGRVTLSSTVKHIGNSAFSSCYGITNVCVDSLEAFGGISFANAEANPMLYSDSLYVAGELCTTTCTVTFVISDDSYYGYGYIKNTDGSYDYAMSKSIDIPCGKTFSDSGEYCYPEVESWGDYVFDHWETEDDGNLNCVTKDFTAYAVFRKRTLQEMVDFANQYSSMTIDLSQEVIVKHAVYDETTSTFRFQGTFRSVSDGYSIFSMLDRENSGDNTEHSLRIDIVLYDKDGIVCSRAIGNRMLYEQDIWTTSINCYDLNKVKYVGLELSSAFYEGTIPICCFAVSEIERKALTHVECNIYGYFGGEFVYVYQRYASPYYSRVVNISDVRAGYVIDITGKYDDMSLGDMRQGTSDISWICEANQTQSMSVSHQLNTYWYCLRINVAVPPNEYHATYDIGKYGRRIGGGDLEQDVNCEESGPEVAPTVEPLPGCSFSGWDSGAWSDDKSLITYTASYGDFTDFSISYTNTMGQTMCAWQNPSIYNLTSEITFSHLLNDTAAWHFVGWEPANIVQGTYGDLVVTAKWEVAKHVISQTATYDVPFSVVTNDYGSILTMTAPTNIVWIGALTNCACIGSSLHQPTTNEFEIVVSNDLVVTWDIWQTNYLFRTVANPTGTWYAYGAEVEQSAVADEGYRFYKWIGDVDGNAYENPKTFVMTQARYVEPVFVEEKVATPTISIPNGTVLSNATRLVTMDCSTPNATIYYTLDGTTPSAENGTKYTVGGFVLSQTAFIQAIAVKDGSDASEIASAAVVHLAEGEELPKIAIAPSTSIQTVKTWLVTFSNVTIPGLTVERRYTIDGSEPTVASELYTSRFTVTTDGSLTIRAAMFVNDARIGEVTSVRYFPSVADVIVKSGEWGGAITIENDDTKPWTVDENMISPNGNLSMRSGRVGANDGSKMVAYFNGDGVLEFNWRTSCEAYTDPENDVYADYVVCRIDGETVAWLDGETDWTNVVISVSTKGEHAMELVYYKDDADDDPYPGEDCAWISDMKFSYAAYITFDKGNANGSVPETIVSSAGYSVQIRQSCSIWLDKHTFVGWQYKDKVYTEGDWLTVDAQEMTLTPVWSEKHLTAPSIDVAAEYDEESTIVSITHDEKVSIYYTTDGSEPTTASKRYSGEFAVIGTTTIKAIAIDDDWFDSPIVSATTTRSWTTLEECLNADGFTLATGGDYNWIGDASEGCVKSVRYLRTDATSWFTATFTGAGVVEWWYRTASSDWELRTKAFNSSGEHTLRWEGSQLWVKDLKFTPAAWAQFISNEPVTGELPTRICSAPGYEITLPSFGGFSREKYTFNGWSDGVNIYHPDTTYTMTGNVTFAVNWSANRIRTPKITVSSWYDTETTTVKIVVTGKHGKIYYTLDGSTPTRESTEYTGEFDVAGTCTIKAFSVCDNYFDSDMAEASTVRAPWTINECLNNTNLVFSMGGNTNWVRCIGASEDGYCMQSGAMENSQETWIDSSVVGAGVLSFACKVSSEGYYRGNPLDYIECRIDGKSAFKLAGITEWTNVTIDVNGDDAHTVRWLYYKDGYQDPVVCDDCAWLDCVRWIPDPIPELSNDATPQEVADALNGSKDTRLTECITNAVNYNAYRDWAANVKTPDGGSKAGAQAVKESDNAWFSFAVGSDKLIDELPTAEDIKVEEFIPSSESGKFDFTVSVEGVTVSGEALKENLKQVFGLEGSTSLDPNGFSSNNVDIDFGTPKDGKVKFTAGPKSGNANTGAFFMKVRVNP